MEDSLTNRPLENENHHWWPKCISKHWKDDQKFVHKLSSDGVANEYKKYEKLGFIPNAHSIKFSSTPTDFDESFESYFDFVDNNKGFKHIISFLKNLEANPKPSKEEEKNNLDTLLECLLSLIVRSPRFRNQIKLSIERITAQNPEDLLISLNQRDAFDKFKSNLLGQGKFAVLFSKEQEFIFGDGFYQNFISHINIPLEPMVMIPILPNICVLYSRPLSYPTEPRLVTRELEKEEVDFINRTTMVYSQNHIFYRSQQPTITQDFSCKQFLEYELDTDPVINAFSQIFSY